MPAEAFIDTNILLYAALTSEDEAAKRAKARQVLAQPDWGLSVQVLQELYINLICPPRCAMSHADAVDLIRQLVRRPVVATDPGLVLSLENRLLANHRRAGTVAA